MNKRKTVNILINKDFQYHFLKTQLAILTGVFICFLLVLSWITTPIYEHFLNINIPFDFKHSVQKTIEIIPIILLLLYLILVCFVTACSLFVSHKIAGPIYNIEKSIDEMIEMDTMKPIKFRSGDYFTTLQDKLNTFISKFEKK